MRLYTADAIKEQVHKLLCKDCEETDVCPVCDYRELIDEILDAPTVDAVPVVRCDDCIYRDGKTPGQPNILCWQMHSDDYCSYGTKREVGTYCEDIVSVVRCKDCKKYIPCQKLPIGTSKWCDLFDRATCEMNYCGWGERRENAD